MDINWQGLIAGAATVFVITYFTKKATFAAKEGDLPDFRLLRGAQTLGPLLTGQAVA